ncbi:MAG TPA: hypothetical protein VH437_03390 [Terriglobales bacterium]|jgi:hypothetical protein
MIAQRIRLASIFTFLILLPGFLSSAQSVDEIIVKTLAARGGTEKVKSVNSERLTGRISVGPGVEGPFIVEIKRGGKMREGMLLNGKTIIRATNGTIGWMKIGDDAPTALSPGDLKNMAGGADLDGPLMDYKAKGNRVEYSGKEKLDGKDTYKLKVTLKDGEVREEYIDCESNLGLKWVGKIVNQEKEVAVESLFSDYRAVDGVMFAFRIDSQTVGSSNQQTITLDKVEVNPSLDDPRFELPAN